MIKLVDLGLVDYMGMPLEVCLTLDLPFVFGGFLRGKTFLRKDMGFSLRTCTVSQHTAQADKYEDIKAEEVTNRQMIFFKTKDCNLLSSP